MLNVSIGVGAAEGASLLRRGTSWSGRPPKIILAGFGFSLGQLPTALTPHFRTRFGGLGVVLSFV